MTADTPAPDHARALEVLGKIKNAPWDTMANMPTNVLDSGGLRVARCDFDGDFDHPQAHANARAIAALPALVALYAAAVELEAALWSDLISLSGMERRRKAWGPFQAALAAVPKAVLT